MGSMDNPIPELMARRASCRNFLERDIPDKVLERILDCAIKSPSTSGFQNYSIIVVKDKEKRKLLGQYSMNQNFIAKAPVAIVFCIDLEREKQIIEENPAPWKEDCNFVNLLTKTMDTAIAAQTLCIAAEAEGLRTVFIANILNALKEVSCLLELPDRVVPSLMVVIGYGKGKGILSGKYDKSVLVHRERYHMPTRGELNVRFKEKYRNWGVKPNEKMLAKILKTSEEYGGVECAANCGKEIERKGMVNPYQFYYGYWYRQSESGLDIKTYLEFLKSKKLYWLNEKEESF